MADLVPMRDSIPADRHPAKVYLASLSPKSQRTMQWALGRAAGALTGGVCSMETLPWHLLRYQHTRALLSWAAEHHKPSSANVILAGVRGVLRKRGGWS